VNLAETGCPLHELPIAVVVGRHLERVVEETTDPVNSDSDVLVLVRVDTDDDIGIAERDASLDYSRDIGVRLPISA
jgi:hypothetical protein